VSRKEKGWLDRREIQGMEVGICLNGTYFGIFSAGHKVC
jgi:hypothetical protein